MKHLYIATALICIAPLLTMANEKTSIDHACSLFSDVSRYLRGMNQRYENHHLEEAIKIRHKYPQNLQNLRNMHLKIHERARIDWSEASSTLYLDNQAELTEGESIVLSIHDNKLIAVRSDMISKYTYLRMFHMPEVEGFRQGGHYKSPAAYMFDSIRREVLNGSGDSLQKESKHYAACAQLAQLLAILTPHLAKANDYAIPLPDKSKTQNKQEFIVISCIANCSRAVLTDTIKSKRQLEQDHPDKHNLYMQKLKEGMAFALKEEREFFEELTGPNFTKFLYSSDFNRDTFIAGLKGKHKKFSPKELLQQLEKKSHDGHYWPGVFPGDTAKLRQFIDCIKELAR